jgi:gluconolactonase
MEEKKSKRTIGAIERFDARIDRLIPPGAEIELLAEGFKWSEGPVWISTGKHLLFSDIPPNVIFKWHPEEGLSEYLKPSGYTGSTPRGGEPGSNGLTLDFQGRLVICEHGDRRVTRLEADGSRTVLASHWEGRRLNSPNDLVFRSNGDLYFTDPPYGLLKLNEDPEKELPFNGVYRVTPEGDMSLLTADLTLPNGLAFSPDEKILYISNSDPQRAIWMAYEVDDEGGISNGRVFSDATAWTRDHKGLPDGLKIDVDGNIFASGPGGINVFTPAGEHLGRISTGTAISNCAWGEDGSVLYLTSHMYICRIQLSTRGSLP